MTSAAATLNVLRRNNVKESGVATGRPIVFAHGFGCSQDTWRLVAPHFERDHRVITFDHVGSGGSDLGAYDRGKYDSLYGYAEDVLEIITQLDLHDVVYAGHSVGAMIGVLAAVTSPARFGSLVLVGPSPSYINDGEYVGGFEHEDIDALLDNLDSNYLGWSSKMAPLIMGNTDRPELAEELTVSFCSTDPDVARHFARVTFLSDNRGDLATVSTPTLIVQSAKDIMAPAPVGEFVHAQIAGSKLVVVTANGHCLNLSHPNELVAEMRSYLK